jgi:hypothetical protein
MSRKARRQLREAITSISHPYLRPASRTHRAEDIITPEGSPKSTPRSTTVELPVIHEPTPVRFAGVVEPSPDHSPPECDNASGAIGWGATQQEHDGTKDAQARGTGKVPSFKGRKAYLSRCCTTRRAKSRW